MNDPELLEQIKKILWKKLGGKKYMQGKGLLVSLTTKSGLSEPALRKCLVELREDNWLNGIASDGFPVGKVTILAQKPVAPPHLVEIRWKNAMQTTGFSEEESFAMQPAWEKLLDVEESDFVNLAKGLLKLKAEQTDVWHESKYIVSARYLLGSSKILDNLPNSCLYNFGIMLDRFASPFSVVLTAGPRRPKNVVLVENPQAFWTAIRTKAINRTAFVVTFGFGLSISNKNDFGNQLASLVEGNRTRLQGAVCQGDPPPIQQLLNHEKIYFWGDFDHAGLQIFLRLKKSVPFLNLSALYHPMYLIISTGKNVHMAHGYSSLVSKANQRKYGSFGNDLTLNLLAKACKNKAIDQEVVSENDIIKYSSDSLIISEM